jgi:hypothetical protein
MFNHTVSPLSGATRDGATDKGPDFDCVLSCVSISFDSRVSRGS